MPEAAAACIMRLKLITGDRCTPSQPWLHLQLCYQLQFATRHQHSMAAATAVLPFGYLLPAGCSSSYVLETVLVAAALSVLQDFE